jgi:hypothetical protein
VVDSSVWYQNYDTYIGFDRIQDIGDASAYQFTSQDIMFADKQSRWYRGILLAKQGDKYLAIGPLDIFVDNQGISKLKYQYWYGTAGETDFSSFMSVPEPATVLLVAPIITALMFARRLRAFKKIT